MWFPIFFFSIFEFKFVQLIYQWFLFFFELRIIIFNGFFQQNN